MTRARLVRRTAGCVLAAAFVGAAAWFFGMDAPHAAGLGAVVFALGALVALLGEQADVSWPAPSPQPRPGARRDVVQLGWSLGARGGRVSPEAVRRLRGLAAEVLDRHGIELDAPAAEPQVARLLGEDTAALLRKGSAAAPRPREFAASLARLEALAAGEPHAVSARSADTRTLDAATTDPRTLDTPATLTHTTGAA